MRSCTAEVTAFGVVVRIEQVFIQPPLGSFQRSQIPANANNPPLFTSKQYGCLVFHPFPFVKAVRRNQASAGLQSIAECGLVRPFPISRLSFQPHQRHLLPMMEQDPISSAKVAGLVLLGSGGSPGLAVWEQCCSEATSLRPRSTVEIFLDKLLPPR